jgi:hypothetical protein
MCAEVARRFEPPLNGGNPERQVRTGRKSIVLLAAVALLAVLSPLVVAASPASAASETITVTTTYDEGAMGGEPIGFNASGFPANSSFAWQIVDDNTENGQTCAGTLATDANGDASISGACDVTFGSAADDLITVTYDGVTVTQPAPPQPPPPPTPTVTSISPSSGPTTGGTAITVTGTGFVAGATVVIGQGSGSVTGAIAATNVKVVSPTEITAVTGGGAKVGTWSLFVITSGGTSAGNVGDDFTY